MDGTGSSLLHFLIVILASPFSGEAQRSANATPSASPASAVTPVDSSATRSQSRPFPESSFPESSFPESSFPDANITGPGCLIDPQLGLVAVATAGGLLVCLLVTTLVLACQVLRLQRRVRAPRPSRSNADLVSGTGYWGTERPELGGLVGPCDSTAVMLEEVRADGRMEEIEETEEREKRDGEEKEEGTVTTDRDLRDGEMPVQSSGSRDSCQEELPVDVENMPLVV